MEWIGKNSGNKTKLITIAVCLTIRLHPFTLGDKYRNTVNFQKNASSADLNLTLQGYEFDHGSTRKLVKLSNNPESSPEGLPLLSRNGGTNFDTFEFLKPLETPSTF